MSRPITMTRPITVTFLVFCFALTGMQDHASAQVLSGIDILEREDFRTLAGKRVGLITNQTGTNHQGDSTVRLMHDSKNVELVALFSPEHGFAGKLDQAVIGDATDATTGLKIHSLYGETRVPTPEMLQGIDTLVFDIQDIGTRFYTYISTMGGAMQAAGRHGIEFYVLDRPNPIDAVTVQGPVLDEGQESFVGFHPIALRHGMTIGELAQMFRNERNLDVRLTVIPIEDWSRSDLFDATGRLWINPSPNMRNLTQAVLYPGIGIIETTNVSVGRGTDTPFEVVGAPWINALELAKTLNKIGLAGVRFVPIWFTPSSSKFAGERCQGINIIVTDRSEFHPLRTGLALATTLRQLFPEDWNTKSLNRLLSSQKTLDGILEGKSVDELQSGYQSELDDFKKRRKEFLIYR